MMLEARRRGSLRRDRPVAELRRSLGRLGSRRPPRALAPGGGGPRRGRSPFRRRPSPDRPPSTAPTAPDLSDLRGQLLARRALEIAAAGGHNLLLVGPPGTGKTMLARRLPGILPPLTPEEAVEATAIHSAAGLPFDALLTTRPFRSPHHTASDAALVGGGPLPRPGEVSLAHNGVLFLDEMPEFRRHVLEALRQPLEDGAVTVSRARGSWRLPARFQLVASHEPLCVWGQPLRMRTPRGPPLSETHLRTAPRPDRPARRGPGDDVRRDEWPPRRGIGPRQGARPRGAGTARLARLRGTRARTNAQLDVPLLRKVATPDAEGQRLLRVAVERLQLSLRGRRPRAQGRSNNRRSR